ncbi:MAG: SNF2-related protein [Acidimicrobiia bacterium]
MSCGRSGRRRVLGAATLPTARLPSVPDRLDVHRRSAGRSRRPTTRRCRPRSAPASRSTTTSSTRSCVALRMRVNLLIADDVGLGKTIEAGLVVQEMLLRHRARTVLVVCPASLCIKWRDEMASKFGLSSASSTPPPCVRCSGATA